MVKVKIEAFKENVRLRWVYEGRRFCLSLGLKDTPTNRAIAQLKVAEIERDIEYGMFDTSLFKYRRERAGTSPIKVWEVFDKYIESKQGQIYEQSLAKYRGLLTSLRTYFKERNAGGLTASDAGKFKAWLADRLAPVTLKQQLTLLDSCWKWALERKMVADNPWKDVAKRVPRGVVKRAQTFSVGEIQAIVRGFRTHRHYAYYADYVEFMLGTGCRPGEAISLTWGDLTDDCSQIWIGKAYANKEIKETKPDKAGFVPLSKSLTDMLLKRRPPNAEANALIFPSPRNGGYMDVRNFRNRAWTTVLAELGIPYRKPYTTRHTLITYWLSQGEDPLTVAKFTRTSVKMIYEHYSGWIPNKTRLPDMLGDIFSPSSSSTGNRPLE